MKADTLKVIQKVLAADYACPKEYLTLEGVFVSQAQERVGRRKFPFHSNALKLVTMGAGVVVTCDSSRKRWVEANLRGLSRDDIFSPSTLAKLENYVGLKNQRLVGPDLKYVCDSDTFRLSAHSHDDVEFQVYEAEQIEQLYAYLGFFNALSYQPHSPHPDVLAVVAKKAGIIIGIACASADSDALWQIGVDVIAEYRAKGVGKEVVNRLTQHVLERGKIPYYSTLAANLSSRNLAISAGYWPCWTELYTKNLQS